MKSVAESDVAPVLVLDPARTSRRAHPRTVVLQPAVDVVGLLHIEAHVIKLPNRNVAAELKRVGLVIRLVHAAVRADVKLKGVLRVHPDGVIVAVRATAPLRE